MFVNDKFLGANKNIKDSVSQGGHGLDGICVKGKLIICQMGGDLWVILILLYIYTKGFNNYKETSYITIDKEINYFV